VVALRVARRRRLGSAWGVPRSVGGSGRSAVRARARRRPTPLARCWLRRPAVQPTRGARAGWAQTLARGVPLRSRSRAKRDARFYEPAGAALFARELDVAPHLAR